MESEQITQKRRVAIQGIYGSFHDIAAHHYFTGEELKLVECDTFEDVFHSMKNDPSMVAMVAIENTIAGSLLHNYELLRESGMTIVGEHKLRISHSIMCLPEDNWADVTEEVDDTAGAARNIHERNLHGHAAICHKDAAKIYNMKILEEGIETNKHNFTRFLVLTSQENADNLRKKELTDKSSLVFSLPHEEGSLSAILSVLSFYKINLTKIQSLPIIGREWEYLFYIDLTFSDYERYRQSLDAIRPLTREMRILGEYSSGRQTI